MGWFKLQGSECFLRARMRQCLRCCPSGVQLLPTPDKISNLWLCTMPTETQEQCVAAAKTVQARGVSQVLVTRGSHGAVLVGADGSITARAANMVEKVVDTTGAGDCFRAAYAPSSCCMSAAN